MGSHLHAGWLGCVPSGMAVVHLPFIEATCLTRLTCPLDDKRCIIVHEDGHAVLSWQRQMRTCRSEARFSLYHIAYQSLHAF